MGRRCGAPWSAYGNCAADPAPHVAELEWALARLRMSVAPLLHPLRPLRARRARARQVMVRTTPA